MDTNRIKQLFDSGKRDLLSIYFCAGHPTLDGTVQTIETLQSNGVDMIEIGIPFSDPMADGVVIQDAATKALANGMCLRLLFEQLKDIRQTVSIPLLLMGYLNPIFHYGYEAFCSKCREIGIDGVIIPDMPYKEYLECFKPIADRYGIKVIMLITPETSDERIREIDRGSDAFIYMVSSAATTGAQTDFNAARIEYFRRIRALGLNNPTMVGFGISNKQTFRAAADHSSGAIIGSKFVSLLDEYKDADTSIKLLRKALEE